MIKNNPLIIRTAEKVSRRWVRLSSPLISWEAVLPGPPSHPPCLHILANSVLFTSWEVWHFCEQPISACCEIYHLSVVHLSLIRWPGKLCLQMSNSGTANPFLETTNGEDLQQNPARTRRNQSPYKSRHFLKPQCLSFSFQETPHLLDVSWGTLSPFFFSSSLLKFTNKGDSLFRPYSDLLLLHFLSFEVRRKKLENKHSAQI